MPQERDRTQALEPLGCQFKYTQVLAGLARMDEQRNQTRRHHRRRHTAIMLRLLYLGYIDLRTLARIARTRLEMVDRLSASQPTAQMKLGCYMAGRGAISVV
jgi:hypothetical protein